jgi:hypothetical protein
LTGVSVAGFNRNPLINANGVLALQIGLTGASVTSQNNLGLYVGAPGNLALVARTGDQAPGAPSGANFTSFNDVSLDSSGDAVVEAYMASATNEGLYYFNHNTGGLVPMVLVGQTLTVGPGDVRTLSSIAPFGDSANQDSFPSRFNDSGQFLFEATFTDNSQGLFFATVPVPEPAGVGILGTAALFCLGRRLQRPIRAKVHY